MVLSFVWFGLAILCGAFAFYNPASGGFQAKNRTESEHWHSTVFHGRSSVALKEGVGLPSAPLLGLEQACPGRAGLGRGRDEDRGFLGCYASAESEHEFSSVAGHVRLVFLIYISANMSGVLPFAPLT